MALDEPKETDEVYKVNGFKFLVDKAFLEKVKPIKIDFSGFGFKLDCGYDFHSGCSSCSTTGSCCST